MGLGAVLLVGVAGCSVGVGEGSATGQVWAPTCGLMGDAYDLHPTFFGADAPAPGSDLLSIRVQRGSDLLGNSDGILVTVNGASKVYSMLGTPITLSDASDALVGMSLYLNETCPPVIGDPAHPPINYVARGGTITFTSIYAPDASGSGKETAATFDNVTFFANPNMPGNQHAVLSGYFRFIFSRGRPAQPFP